MRLGCRFGVGRWWFVVMVGCCFWYVVRFDSIGWGSAFLGVGIALQRRTRLYGVTIRPGVLQTICWATVICKMEQCPIVRSAKLVRHDSLVASSIIGREWIWSIDRDENSIVHRCPLPVSGDAIEPFSYIARLINCFANAFFFVFSRIATIGILLLLLLLFGFTITLFVYFRIM